MLEPLRAATLPTAPIGVFGVDAAPAVDDTAPAARSVAAPVPRSCIHLRERERCSVDVSMIAVASFLFLCRGMLIELG
jgi:hypothetical protein